MPAAEPRGQWFEDLDVGRVFESESREVRLEDIDAFAALSGDHHPLHTDERYARRTAFRGRIAHGLLVQSIASGLATQSGIFDGTLTALEAMTIEYQRPVRPGDTVRLRLEVRDREQDPGPKRGRVRFAARVENQAGECVIDGEWRTLMLRRPQPAPE